MELGMCVVPELVIRVPYLVKIHVDFAVMFIGLVIQLIKIWSFSYLPNWYHFCPNAEIMYWVVYLEI